MNKKILNLSSEIEALRIREILESQKIPHLIRSFYDSAYDGIFQNQYGWGVLEADEKDESKILELVKDILSDNQ